MLPHALIEAHLREVTALLRRHDATTAKAYAALPPAREEDLMTAMLELHRRADPTRRLLAHWVVHAIPRQLFAAEPIVTMARSALWAPTDMKAHVDTAFRSPDPPYSICRTWCALEDIHPDSGRLFLVPGTHRTLTPHLCREVLDERPELQNLFEQVADEPNAWFRLLGRGWSYVSAKVADRIDPKAMVSFDLRKGDVVFFNPAVAHGTLACTDPSLTRKMMVCEWTAAEGTRHLLPRWPASRRHARPDLHLADLVDLGAVRAERAASSRI